MSGARPRGYRVTATFAAGVLALASCALPARGPRFRLAATEPLPAAGQPEAVLWETLGAPMVLRGTRDGTETFYYFDTRRDDCGRGCVEVVTAQGRVLSAQRAQTHPPWASDDGLRPGRAVSDGRVRLGQSAAAVRQELGAPSGITARRGVELWHYLSEGGLWPQVRIDGRVWFDGGRVVAYEDRFVDGYDPRLPGGDEDRPSGGKVHVGMTPEEVAKVVGPAHEVVDDGPDEVHRYFYPALVPGLTREVTEQVVYRRGVVDGIGTLDHTLEADRQRWEQKRNNWSFITGGDDAPTRQ